MDNEFRLVKVVYNFFGESRIAYGRLEGEDSDWLHIRIRNRDRILLNKNSVIRIDVKEDVKKRSDFDGRAVS